MHYLPCNPNHNLLWPVHPVYPPAARHLSAELRITLGAQNWPFLIWITLLQEAGNMEDVRS